MSGLTGIQILRSDDERLINSIWLLEEKAGEAKCACSLNNVIAEGTILPIEALSIKESRSVRIETTPRIEWGQNININVIKKDTLIDEIGHPEKYPSLTVRISGHAVRFNSLPA